MKQLALLLLLCVSMSSCVFPPPADYAYRPSIVKKRDTLTENLIKLLPEDISSKDKIAARKEADWISFTAYDRSAAIARFNKTILMNWANNALVNIDWRDRGLCYHYQHDLYRDLRRQKLHYFDLHLTVRDHRKGSEHHCVYVCAKDKTLMQGIILDPWLHSGKLDVIYPEDRQDKEWTEEPDFEITVSHRFPVGHTLPEFFHIPDPKKYNKKDKALQQ